jgi:ATP-dependent Zn protease
MGGRVAEMVTFGRATTGAGSDIERATQIARKMVTEWGMSDRLGTLSFGTPQEEVFSGVRLPIAATIRNARRKSSMRKFLPLSKMLTIRQKKSLKKILTDCRH